MIVDPKNPKKDSLKCDQLTLAKIKKIAEVLKDKDQKTGAEIVKGVKEKYVYRERKTKQRR